MWQRVLPFVGGVLAASVAIWAFSIARSPRSGALGRAYATGRGERETVTLADGTRFTLAPATRVRLGAEYDGARRDVYLDGEAMFVVAHDARRPFVVHAGNAVAQDVGTQFDVRHYAGGEPVRVAVAEGAVTVGDSAGVVATRPTMHGGDLARVDATGRTTVSAGAGVDEALAWTRGELAFHDTPLREVIPEIERWYDIDIRLADPALAARPLTATYGSQSLGDVLELFTSAVGARYERRGRTVTVYAASR